MLINICFEIFLIGLRLVVIVAQHRALVLGHLLEVQHLLATLPQRLQYPGLPVARVAAHQDEAILVHLLAALALNIVADNSSVLFVPSLNVLQIINILTTLLNT